METCPQPGQLEQYRLGLLSAKETEPVEQHVLTCETCLSTLRNIAVTDVVVKAFEKPRSCNSSVAIEQADVSQLIRQLGPLIEQCNQGNEQESKPITADDPHGVRRQQGPTAEELGTLGQYRIRELLGRGGMGMVFLGEDMHLHREVAIKIMSPWVAHNDGARERFLRESRAAAAIKSPHVVTIYHVGEDRGIPYIAMELLQGQTLQGWLQAGARPTLDQLVRLGTDVALGLAAAHERGLIHRDIKPGNIWLEEVKEDGDARENPQPMSFHAKILDFGLARSETSESLLTGSGVVVGTIGYICPENAAGAQVDVRSDLFSLGCVLYRLATGSLPFPGKDLVSHAGSLASHRLKPPHTLNPDLPRGLSRLIMELLRKNREDRPQSAREVALRCWDLLRRLLPFLPQLANWQGVQEG